VIRHSVEFPSEMAFAQQWLTVNFNIFSQRNNAFFSYLISTEKKRAKRPISKLFKGKSKFTVTPEFKGYEFHYHPPSILKI
jgi:hypothetical protein